MASRPRKRRLWLAAGSRTSAKAQYAEYDVGRQWADGANEKSHLKALTRVSATFLAFGLSACTEDAPSEYDVSMTLTVEQVPAFLSRLNEDLSLEMPVPIYTDFAEALPRYNDFAEPLPVEFEGRRHLIVYRNTKSPSGEITLSIESKSFSLAQSVCQQMREFARDNDSSRALSDCSSKILATVEDTD